MSKSLMKKTIAFLLLCAMLTSILPKVLPVYAADQDPYEARFMELWAELHDPDNGYFSPEGIPYHSIETLIVEAPDYGHVTTSEALSYYMWLEAMYGKFTGDFSGFEEAWNVAESYAIPTEADQPNTSMNQYSASKPATYAPEWEDPSLYPAQLDFNATVGSDPIHNELVSAYGDSMMYGMHWLLDVDNWYGYGSRGDGTSTPSYINTFQRGSEESTWETIPQPCWDALTFGGENGYLDLFTGDSQYAEQFKYTNAPDADARAVQATYWGRQWAEDYGVDIDLYIDKASKMGDYLRYSMFDKYFRQIGSPSNAGSGYDAAHYLLSWYYAWGGGITSNWAWKIGSSHSHFGYQNPMAAWILSEDSEFEPKSQNGANDWQLSLDRQLEFYQWLQSAEGAIAGGASNSNNGRYEEWPEGTSTFYSMGYVENPVYLDPGSNTWFGFQAWSMQRVAEYYYQTQDQRAKTLLENWVNWVKTEVQLNGDGTFAVPSTLDWRGQPDTWTGTSTGNPNLHVTVVDYGTDLGVTGSLANALLYYSKASGDDEARVIAKELLDRMWNLYRDDKGLSAPESRADYNRFFEQEVYVPEGWNGTMPNGDVIEPGVTFLDIRSDYLDDPDYQKLLDAYNAGTDPIFNYHRFWAQCDIALANGLYSILFGEGSEPVKHSSITPTSADFDKYESNQDDILVEMTLNGNTFEGIRDNNDALIEGTDYSVAGNQVIVLKEYLREQPIGSLVLTFDFSEGIDPSLTVTITDSTSSATIEPTEVQFDKASDQQADVSVQLTLNGHELEGILLDEVLLVEATDYRTTGSTVTLSKEFLATQPVGQTTIKFDVSGGIDPELALTIIDSSVVVDGDMKVQMFNGNKADVTNGIAPRIKLYNTGSTDIQLSDVTLRYYYTIDGEKAQNFWCDWSTIGSGNVIGTFVKMDDPKANADYYLEVGFNETAGQLLTGQSIEIQVRFSKVDWTNYAQTGDYSYNGISNEYVDHKYVTGYLANNLQWGIEP